MSEKNSPAFPSSPTLGPNGHLWRPVDIGCGGISIRDYFAAAALQGLMANPLREKYMHSLFAKGHSREFLAKTSAEDAYLIADEMVKAGDL